MNMEKHEIAVKDFMEGYRCSQAVVAAYAESVELDIDLARKISLPLAGGSAVGGECGAVSGAYVVIGLKHGFAHPGDPGGVAMLFKKIGVFVEKFKSLHGEIDCHKLLKLDVFSEEGQRIFSENKIKANKCAHFVSDAVKILEEILVNE
jgi:C_GCAxxG_C_C family probable redox protein